MSVRIAVDTGGTFTDIVVADSDGAMTLAKALTTPDRIFRGIEEALGVAAEARGTSLTALLSEAATLVYGTTRATNAIVTGQIARTAFLTTRGFPDTLVIREGGKFEAHDFSQPFPKPYIARRHTFEIDERIDAEGAVVRALDEDGARNLLRDLRTRGFEAVAVCLLWSIANSVHEERLGELIEDELPGVPFTLSHRLNPILREYRRASSTAIDASIKPLMQEHLRELRTDLHAASYRGELLVSTTIGGCVDIETTADRPIHTVRSGPAMAPVAAREYAEGSDTIIVVDTGGTTFDVGLVRDGRIVGTQETWLGERFSGHMLGIPAVDVRSVGAGGGSIAWLDSGGLLRVGPESAGAMPGPACYGQGGALPTVTDAALVLGYLDPEFFLGGRMKIHPEAARDALQRLADPLNLPLEALAFSVLAVANETMINAIKDITVSEGVDPREAVLVAGGGAAGIGILAIARELGCRRVVVPRTASVLSACGMQFSDIQMEESRSLATRSTDFDHDSVNRALESIDEGLLKLAEPLAQRGLSDREITYRVSAHYAAQVWEIDVPLPFERFRGHREVDELIAGFHTEHERIYAVTDPGSAIEFLHWTGRLTLRLPGRLARGVGDGASAGTEGVRTRRAWFGEDEPHDAQVVRGAALSAGGSVAGPAIIEEETTTLVVPPGFEAVLTQGGCYEVQVPTVGTAK